MEAKSNSGKYTVWIDPAHGYNVAKARVYRKGDDLHFDKPLNSPAVPLSPEMRNLSKKRKPSLPTSMVEFSYTMDDIHFEKYEDIWIPTATMADITIKFEDGRVVHSKNSIRKEQINLKPDFKALGAFVLDFPDGTRAFDLDNPDTSIQYEWRKGKLAVCADKEKIGEEKMRSLLAK